MVKKIHFKIQTRDSKHWNGRGFPFACLFAWGFSSHSHSYGDVTITGEGLHILTYAWQSLSDENGASVYNGYPRGPMTLTPIAEIITVELSQPDFTT